MTDGPVLVVDDARRVERLVRGLRAAGIEAAASVGEEPPVAVVLGIDTGHGVGTWPDLPVVAVADAPDAELRLALAVDGALACCGRSEGAGAVAAALVRVLDPDAGPLDEQRRRERITALEAFAAAERAERADAAEGAEAGTDDSAAAPGIRVHLTRLEQGPVRAAPPAPTDGPARLDECTPKQRELLETIVAAGGVTRAALQLGVSRSTIYAALRRIAHRVQLRDAGDLLRLVGVEDNHPRGARR
ncbi:MAG: hypothetical protein ACKOBG_11110 [Actinomycetota bacterium]